MDNVSETGSCTCDPCHCDELPESTIDGDGDANDICNCNPCMCDTPDGSCLCDPCMCDLPDESLVGEDGPPQDNCGKTSFTLDEFLRAKEFFMKASTNSGLNVYDHLSELLRKMLDERNPPNIVDFMEEISLNIKRYRFGLNKQIVRDAHYISPPMLADAYQIEDIWKQHALWSQPKSEEMEGEDHIDFGGFPNLMRLLYYTEQVNVGLPREEMFRIALSINPFRGREDVSRARFWGKIFGITKSYYVVEVEFHEDQGPDDIWQPPPPTPPPEETDERGLMESADGLPGSSETFQRAGGAVTDQEILAPYQETSGLPPGATSIIAKPLPGNEDEFFGEDGGQIEYTDPDSAAEVARWEQYQSELMTGFPIPPPPPPKFIIPSESTGEGLNRPAFYVCNELGEDWVRLPNVVPEHITWTRALRWQLSGTLAAKVKTFPEFPGLEANFLRALIDRVTHGSQVSPHGYFRTTQADEEELGEEEEDEEQEIENGDDTVYPVKKFRPNNFLALLDPNVKAWVHHTASILRQGRLSWVKPIKEGGAPEDEEEDGEDVEEEEDDEEKEVKDKEVGPFLFRSLSEDESMDGTICWSTRPSSTVFTEFQIASVRSNLWPGATALCTMKGKVENIYFGDGLKFSGSTYAPPVQEEAEKDYVIGPELMEITDPTVQEEQDWLAKLQLEEIADVEPKFKDNEAEETGEDDTDSDDTETTITIRQ